MDEYIEPIGRLKGTSIHLRIFNKGAETKTSRPIHLDYFADEEDCLQDCEDSQFERGLTNQVATCQREGRPLHS